MTNFLLDMTPEIMETIYSLAIVVAVYAVAVVVVASLLEWLLHSDE